MGGGGLGRLGRTRFPGLLCGGPGRTAAARQGGPAHVRGSDNEERQGDEHHRQRQGGRRVVLPLQVDGQRHGAGDALLGAGEGDGRSELAQAAPQGQGGAAHQRRCRQRQGDAHQDPPRARPQGAGDGLRAGVAAAQRGLQGDHQVGHGDEDLGDDDGCGCEGDLHAQGGQWLPEQPPLAEGRQQGDARDHRRHGHGQHSYDAGDPHPRPLSGQQQRQRNPQGYADGRGDQAGARREP